MIEAKFGKFKEEMFLIQQDVNAAFFERAINRIEDLIERFPDRAEPYYEMGRLSYNFWRNDEAEKNYCKAIEIDPTYFPTYTQFALILIKAARFDEAEALLIKSQTIQSREDSDIYFYFGMLYQHKGELDNAITSYKKAIGCCINESQIDLNLKFIRACIELRGWE